MSLRVFITGSAGFAGSHLIDELRAAGHTPVGYDLTASPKLDSADQRIGSIEDRAALQDWIAATQPDACVHLAGMSFVPTAWEQPQKTMDVNLTGTLNVLTAFHEECPQARLLIVTSSEVYGRNDRREPVMEEDALLPSSLYGVSKAAADLSSLLFGRHHGMCVMTARPQNHIGPGQSERFVVMSFARQIADLATGKTTGSLKVGNLEARRDFTDVRDTVRAYRLLMERGVTGEAYNIASGRTVPVQELLDELCLHAGIRPVVEIDPSLYRPADRPPQLSIRKISSHVGWEPGIPLSRTLKDIYDAVRPS